MNGARLLFATVTLGMAGLFRGPVHAGSQDDLLRDVHAVLRITGAHIEWSPNGIGGLAPVLVYDLTNVTGVAVAVPVTVRAGTAANWAGVRQHWIERLDSDSTIPAIPKRIAKRGRRYAHGGWTIAWPGQVIAPRGFVRFREPIPIGGFPSGRYAIYVDYETTHEQRLIQSQVVYFAIP